MTLSDNITTLYAELTQRQKAQQARALLQNLRSVVIETNSQIQAIADSGEFNTLDAAFLSAVVKAWNVSKATETALEEADIAELLDWRP